MIYTMCCPVLFGLEGIVADELRYNGRLTEVHAENGRVFFEGDAHTLAWANINLRCAERVLLRLGSFHASSFDELFEGVRALPLEKFIPRDGSFPVKGHSLNSALHSVPDCQKIIKKAAVERLGKVYGVKWFEETGAKYQIQFAIMRDTVELYLDTTGPGLHKRGYRAHSNAAPLRETLAAAMVKLARWRGRGPLVDPFCGSGTIPIEAAMIAMKRAPGISRAFDAENWECINPEVWRIKREEARALELPAEGFEIIGSDIDPDCVRLSVNNARKAGVEGAVRFEKADAVLRDYAYPGLMFANPPYGERLMDVKAAEEIYRALGRAMKDSPMKQYILSPDPFFESRYGKKADRKRKMYNGMIKCSLFMYFKHSQAQCAKTSRPDSHL